ncbi:MAG: hypothetical protein V1867_03420 [Candidatus Falkowbacteria bacterium]
MTKRLIATTPTKDYFTDEAAEKLNKLYAIRTMEQLVSIAAAGSAALQGMAKSIGMQEEDFNAIIKSASQAVKVPRYSGQKYPI